jgi:hypothetical protein
MANVLEIHASGGIEHLGMSVLRFGLGALLLACFICILVNVKTETKQMEALQWMYLASGASMIVLTFYQLWRAYDDTNPFIVPRWFDSILFMFALCVGSVGFANDSVISNNSSPVQATGATGPVSEPPSQLSDTTISVIRATNAISILFGAIGFVLFLLWIVKLTKRSKPVVTQQYVIQQPGAQQYVVQQPGQQYVVQQPGPQAPVMVIPTMEQ